MRRTLASSTRSKNASIGGQTANVVTLKATFDQETALAPIGGAKYLARVAGGGAHLARVEVQHVVVKASSEKLHAGKDGTRAIARAGSTIPEIERKKLAHDRVTQRVITEAGRTMRTDKYKEFALALCEERPPRWACSERDRIWRQIKRERNASGAAHAT
jgi:hypothetical protein